MTQETRRLKIPYPSDGQDPYYPAFEAMVKSFDSIAFSEVSDRNILLHGGGDISWSNSRVSFTEDIVFAESTYGQVQLLKAQDDIYLPAGHFLYVELSRGNTSEVVLTGEVDYSVPVNTQATTLAWHNPKNGKLFWRSGAQQVDGQVIAGVDNTGTPNTSNFVLAGNDPSLPNARVLVAGQTNTVNVLDSGAGGSVSVDLKPINGVSGNYTLASFDVNEFGQISSISEYDPQVLNARTIDLDIEPTAGMFKVYTNNVGIMPAGGFGEGVLEMVATDSGGTQHSFLTQSWESRPAQALDFMSVSLIYTFKIPRDAVQMGDGVTLFRHFMKVSGHLADTSVLYVLKINGNIYQVNQSLTDQDIVTDIAFNSIQNILLVQNARATLEVRVSNQVQVNSPFAVDFGPLQLTFSNVVTP